MLLKLCGLVGKYHRFGKHNVSLLRAGTLVSTYESTTRHNLEQHDHYSLLFACDVTIYNRDRCCVVDILKYRSTQRRHYVATSQRCTLRLLSTVQFVNLVKVFEEKDCSLFLTEITKVICCLSQMNSHLHYDLRRNMNNKFLHYHTHWQRESLREHTHP